MKQWEFDYHVTKVRNSLAEVAKHVPPLWNDWPLLRSELVDYANRHNLNISVLGEH